MSCKHCTHHELREEKSFCKFNQESIIAEPEVCAAKHLTRSGWIHAVNVAENVNNDYFRGQLYRKMIKP